MGSSKLMFLNMVLGLALMLADQLEGGGVLPVLHFIDASSRNIPAPIKLQIRAGGILRGSTDELKPHFEINVKIDEVYYAFALFEMKFAEFHAYEPARDKNHDAVYWKADNDGFSLSYDKANWMNVTSWQSE